MSGLLFLSTDDFSVQQGSKGSLLCNKIKGFSLILFYSTQCIHCQTFIPIFKRLPGSLNGCQFGMVNVSKNKELVRMSKDTLAQIEYVPLVILYLNGIPIIRYDGPHVEEDVRNFVIEVAQKLQNKEKFMEGSDRIKTSDRSLPAYSLGKPLYGDDNDKKCFLKFSDAYQTEQKGRR